MWASIIFNLDSGPYKQALATIKEPVTTDNVYDATALLPNDIAQVKKAYIQSSLMAVPMLIICWYLFQYGRADFMKTVLFKGIWVVSAAGAYFGIVGARRAHHSRIALEDLAIRGEDALAQGGEMREAFDARASAEHALHSHRTEMFELNARRSAAADMAAAAASSAQAAAASVEMARQAQTTGPSPADIRRAEADVSRAASDLAWAERTGTTSEISSARASMARAEVRARASGA